MLFSPFKFRPTSILLQVFLHDVNFFQSSLLLFSWDWGLWGESVPVTPPQQQLHPWSNAPYWQDHGVSLKEYVSFWNWSTVSHVQSWNKAFLGSGQSFSLTLLIRSLKPSLIRSYSVHPWTGKVVSDLMHVPWGNLIVQVTHSGKQPLHKWVISQECSVQFFIIDQLRKASLCKLFYSLWPEIDMSLTTALPTKGCIAKKRGRKASFIPLHDSHSCCQLV